MLRRSKSSNNTSVNPEASSQTNNGNTKPAPAPTPPAPTPAPELAAPVADFKPRITKKFFGTYITPQNSPVQPERFSGYHTGVDVEYGDVSGLVPVYAIAPGTVTYSGWVSGYGGVVCIKSTISGVTRTVLYGHLAPSSLPTVGSTVARAQPIGHLGQAYSSETDGERRHLHLAVTANGNFNLRGYVSNQSQLSGWLDPLSLPF